MVTSIGLTGDVMLGRLVDERQRTRPVTAVWGDLTDRLRALEGLFINLECCLSARGEPWTRTYRPFHFRADPYWAIPALLAVDVDCCALANNHVLDFGERALRDTLTALDEANIAHAGAGKNQSAAFEPTIVDVNSLAVGFLSFTDNTPEFAARENSPGTAHIAIDVDNETTRRRVLDALARAKDADLVIASLHWGPNMVERPPETFQHFARWLIDVGVDIIHGHSAHVFHGIEVYEGRPILYDTGDFVDDYAVDHRLRNDRGFLFTIEVTDDGRPTAIRLTPTEIADCSVRHASLSAATWIRTRMRQLSEPFDTRFDCDGEQLVVSLGRSP